MTPVKNQGSCGSCWTYGAVGPMEYIYKKVTGNLVPLSEQELLDCTYEGTGQDGCDGGWYHQAWDFVIGGTYDNGKTHLATQKNYPYTGQDGKCSHGAHPNALDNLVQLTGYIQVAATEDEVLRPSQCLLWLHLLSKMISTLSGRVYTMAVQQKPIRTML